MNALSIRPDTRLVFGMALEKLMSEKSFYKITVNDITSTCQAHRSTFYRYFNDKMDLAEWYFRYLADQEVQRIVQEGVGTSDPLFAESVFLALLKLMKKKKQFFQKLAQYDGQNSFDKIFFRWNMDHMLETIKDTYSVKELPQNIKYALNFYYHGETELIMEWARNGMKEAPDVLLGVALDNLPPLLRPYVHLSSSSQTQQGCE